MVRRNNIFQCFNQIGQIGYSLRLNKKGLTLASLSIFKIFLNASPELF